MKLCLVSQEYPPETAHGGIGAQTYLKAQGLAARGHEIFVLSHSLTDERVVQERSGIRIIRIPAPDHRLDIRSEPVRWLAYSENVAAELDRLDRQVGLDLIDFPEWGSEAYVHLLNREGERGPKVAIHLHGPLIMFVEALGWPENGSLFHRVGVHMEETCLRAADAIFSSSACSAGWCARHYGLDQATIPVIHTGVDTGHFRPIPTERDGRPTILFIGKVAQNKGLGLLARAALTLAASIPGLRLRIVGRGDEKLAGRLQEEARQAGFPDLLEFAGYIQREDLPDEFSRADVFAAPSAYEGGPGFVYLEAMACGLPVIACSGSGGSEAVDHGETGLLVLPGDREALEAALRDLLRDAPLRAEMGRKGAEHVRNQADSRLCLGRLEDFYRSVIDNAGRQGAA